MFIQKRYLKKTGLQIMNTHIDLFHKKKQTSKKAL